MKLSHSILAFAALGLTIVPSIAHAQSDELQSPDEQSAQLFHNSYTGGAADQATAGLYPAPHPTPRNAGHVFYTYQPLQPHQLMYEHNRTYYNTYGGPEQFYRDPCNGDPNCLLKYGGAGVNKTTVTWQHGGTFATPYPFSIYPMENLRRAAGRIGGVGRGFGRGLGHGGLGHGGLGHGGLGHGSLGHGAAGCSDCN